jgi:hypothetical protein
MTRAEIIDKVRKRMDEFAPFDAAPMLLGSNEAMQPVGYQIEDVLDICTDFILQNAPLRCVKSTIPSQPPTATITDRVARVLLPSDFIRLNTIRFSDWYVPVHVFTEYNSRMAELQRFKYTRAGGRKPVAVLNENDGDRILECYTTDGTLTEFAYVASSHFDATDKDIMNDDATDLLLSHVAAKVYNRLNEADFEKIAIQHYTETLSRIAMQG